VPTSGLSSRSCSSTVASAEQSPATDEAPPSALAQEAKSQAAEAEAADDDAAIFVEFSDDKRFTLEEEDATKSREEEANTIAAPTRMESEAGWRDDERHRPRRCCFCRCSSIGLWLAGRRWEGDARSVLVSFVQVTLFIFFFLSRSTVRERDRPLPSPFSHRLYFENCRVRIWDMSCGRRPFALTKIGLTETSQ
jgi:hypothetical protein